MPSREPQTAQNVTLVSGPSELTSAKDQRTLFTRTRIGHLTLPRVFSNWYFLPWETVVSGGPASRMVCVIDCSALNDEPLSLDAIA